MRSKRQKIIKVRVTEEEHRSLMEIRSSKQLAKWMRETCLGQKGITGRKFSKVDPDLLRQLVAIGNNLNQISRAINREEWEPINRIMVSIQLEAIEQQMEKVRTGK